MLFKISNREPGNQESLQKYLSKSACHHRFFKEELPHRCSVSIIKVVFPSWTSSDERCRSNNALL